MADEPLLGINTVLVDWPVLRQNLRIFKICVVFLGHEGLKLSCVRDSFSVHLLLASRQCSFILSAIDLEVSPIYIGVQSWHES